MLLDSNIIIYAARADGIALRTELKEFTSSVSSISRVEVLGYHGLTDETKAALDAVFEHAEVLPMSDEVIDEAISLRQQRSIKLGDAVIAATALVYDLTLMTRNTRDFARFDGIRIYNPFEQ